MRKPRHPNGAGGIAADRRGGSTHGVHRRQEESDRGGSLVVKPYTLGWWKLGQWRSLARLLLLLLVALAACCFFSQTKTSSTSTPYGTRGERRWVWKNVVHKGDTVVDATCGNGHDTLAILRLAADESGGGFVYGMDIQSSALESTASLLDESVNQNQRKLVRLFCLCHSKMEDVIPEGASVRLIAFNLGYLPGGDKGIITASSTTLLALQAASRILVSGGLISIVAYVGHPGGREEYETVQAFASGLPVDSWACCKLEMLNRPAAPVLILLFRK